MQVHFVGYSLVAAFAVTCITSCVLLALYRRPALPSLYFCNTLSRYQRLESSMQQMIWLQFPRFLASCCVGSAVGAVAWAARTQVPYPFSRQNQNFLNNAICYRRALR